ARDASYSDDKTSLLLNDADLAMSAEDGKLVRVKAPLAKLALDGNHVKRADLSGGTRIAYGDFVLVTDRAVFLPDADEVSAPGAVTLEGEGMKATGIGLSGHPKTREFELLKNVTTAITPKPDSTRPRAERAIGGA